MTPQPPHTQEQFELLERVVAKALEHLAIFDEDEVDAALRSVLAYARLGVACDALLHTQPTLTAAGVELLRRASARLLAPAAQEEKRDG